MTMRTYRYFTCSNGHKGTEKTSENEGMVDAGEDARGYAAYTCATCRKPMSLDMQS